MNNAQQIVDELNAAGFIIKRNGDRLRIRPGKRVTDELLELIAANKPDLLQYLADSAEPKPGRAILKFRLIENQGGGTVLGAEGDTLQDLKADLLRRYGKRLAWMRE